MRNSLHLLFIFLFFSFYSFSCKKKVQVKPELKGQYKLFWVRLLPAWGWKPIQSEKFIYFHGNGIFTTNHVYCHKSSKADTLFIGSYSLIDSTLSIEPCISHKVHLENENTLIISPSGCPCIDPPCIPFPCELKYLKEVK